MTSDDLLKQAGVYRITCKANGKIYIGSSIKISQRFYNHKRNLNRGNHHSRSLQSSWNKYGEDAFEFEVLLVCHKSDTFLYEQIYLDYFKPSFNTQTKAQNNSLFYKQQDQKREKQERNKLYLFNGTEMTLLQISESQGISYDLLRRRIVQDKKTVDEAIAMGDSQVVFYEFNGESKSVSAWAREFGVAQPRLYWYIKNGLSIEQALQKMQIAEKKLSLLEFCRLNSTVATTIKSRIKSGMSIMQAITTETRKMERKNGRT